ncbi:TetR/AcrR family transcriptional regulator [Risungbinella massiliensis]|uniref:TetR/AcrR family transcriptional regulator n=1 Tax=Risungbinella massiliensis TaxID=1329796 RepID=UPI000699F75E|nr:TetR/AcrR family transcriptional regulator [Risungbinella massiliensis]
MKKLKEKSFERKAELFEAALDEFTSKNYKEASLNNIIKNAGISKGTFYYHFQDKQDLYLFLLESASKSKWEFVRNRINENIEDYEGKDIFERFKSQGRIGVEFAMTFPKYHQLSKMFMKEKGNKIYDIAKATLGSNTEKLLEEMIKKAIKNGDFKEEFSEDFLIRTISYLFVHFDEIFYMEEDLEFQRMIMNLDHYVDFMRRGLGK